jgi:calcineurin-like phosphoesterase family protein
VFLGDLVDGGAEPSDVLWAVMDLHAQAPRHGGRVILLKGNHEHMLLRALGGDAVDTTALREWVVHGGLETMIRLAHRMGHAIPGHLLPRIFTPAFGELDDVADDVLDLAEKVRAELRPEIEFIQREGRAAAIVNGCVLAVHGMPNFEADSLGDFVVDDDDEVAIAWGRRWLEDWRGDAPDDPFTERLRDLKSRIDAPADGIDIRHVLFGHTVLSAFEVPGMRGQFRVGRLLEGDADSGVPGLYDLITTPRAVARGGALGGLQIDSGGVFAVYGRAMANELGSWPQKEQLAKGDAAFKPASP